MDSKIKTLITELNIEEYEDELKSCLLSDITINKKNKTSCFNLKNDTNLKVDTYKDIFNRLNDKYKEYYKRMGLTIKCDNPNMDYFKDYYLYALELCKDKEVLSLNFSDDLIEEDGHFFIEVSNKGEEHQVKNMLDKLNSLLSSFGYDIELSIKMNKEKDNYIKEEISKAKEEVVIPEKVAPKEKEVKGRSSKAPLKKPQEGAILGRNIKDKPVSIHSLVGEEAEVTVECYIFEADAFESSKSEYKIITLSVSDNTDSIYTKIFVRDKEEYDRLRKELKKDLGKWYLIRGYTKNDPFSKELVLNARDIVVSDKVSDSRKDKSEEKRVELHAHTKMSQMDGVMDATAYLKQAVKWGWNACAITDHNGAQAYPDVYHFVTKHNSSLKDGEKPFKALYGVELTMVDDQVDIVINETNDDLLESTYVVFDLETTGFNAAGDDSIIEIGAVKLHNGEIIDRFDELINPGRKLPSAITELTNITDEMLKDKPSEEESVKKFIEWVGDLPVVAHNAKFDTSFIFASFKKYNLGEFKNTIIDTLKLSQTLDTGFARHSLSALVKRYDVEWDEDAHHRGDYDAEGTAKVFHKMLKKVVNNNNMKTISDLNRLVSKDEIYKYGVTHHINIIAKNKIGLKHLYEIISVANTKYFYKVPRIPRSVIENLREGLLIGSGCYESEVFTLARSKTSEELSNIINFYDYVEVQPPSNYIHLLETHDFDSKTELINNIKKIIEVTKSCGKYIVATSDAHELNKEDKIYREIIVNQKVPGGGRHPLAKNEITEIPNQYLRTTDEMLEEFSFLGEDLAKEIVITNTNKLADECEILEVIIETGGIPFSPKVANDDGTGYLDCPKVVTDLVFTKAEAMYGDPLPYNIEERISTELYGDIVKKICEASTSSDEELYKVMHEHLLKGKEHIMELVSNYVKNNWNEEKDGSLTDKSLEKKVKKTMGGVIGGGFDPIYLISQRLVKHSNDEGYLVGSRGSVGSSFVATMMGITEVNPLPAHYLCKNRDCKYSEFIDDNGTPYGVNYSSGYDLPNKKCPKCGKDMGKEGQDMPFATFLGFNADKVPDIDLNFSGDNQSSAHAYTKVLFGEDNVLRAGTIGTVADKTAYGYVKGYLEDKGITNMRSCEVVRLAAGCTGVKRTTGQHPGGIVVIPQYMDVYDFTPYQYPADDLSAEWKTTHFDYHAIQDDVLKLDILGHDDPTILKFLGDHSDIDIMSLPFDDKEVFSLLTSPKALGVTSDEIECPTGSLGLPEVGTRFVINMLEQTKPSTFSEIVKISGLSHGTDVWAGNAEVLIRDNVVAFKDVIGCRDDIMVNLMNWGVPPKTSFDIMEFVRKGRAVNAKKPDDPETWKGYVELMKNYNIPDWYITSCSKIQYMFPKAHACAYVMSMIRIAWFKIHQPSNYYAAYFSIRVDDFDIETMIKGYNAIKTKMADIQAKGNEATNKDSGIYESLHIALEATARGIKFGNIDLNKSDSRYFIIDENDPNTLIPPFKTIDGLGENVSNQIVEERKKKPFLSIEDLQSRGKVSSTLIEKMKSMGILDDLPDSSQLTLF